MRDRRIINTKTFLLNLSIVQGRGISSNARLGGARIYCGARGDGMRRTARLAMGVGWCGLVATGLPAQPQKPAGSVGGAGIFSGGAKPDQPGLAVLVKNDGRVVFERGYGVKELRTGSKIDTKTDFRLESVARQFTEVAI